MAGLKKREIIILAVAAIFVLYAIYELLIAGHLPVKAKVKTGGESVKIESLISGLNDELNKNKLSAFENYVIKRTADAWGKNPFIGKNMFRAWLAKDGKGVAVSVKIIYSGYVDSGKRKMAVLNDIEYRIGEALEEEGYVLKSISPSKVIIFDKRSGSNIEIPIQE